MPYTGEVIRRATEQLKEDAQRNQRDFDWRRQELYRRAPRLQEIDRLLSKTIRQAAQAAFLHGTDPLPALQRAKAQNLSLQEEKKALLRQLGYPKDALTYRPLCPLCEDRGWKGSEMCICLRQRCGREQIKDLSSMLDLGDQTFDNFDLDYYSPVYDPAIKGDPRSMMEYAQDVCFNYADKFGVTPTDNLLLSGPPGLGKTYLSAAMARVVSERGYSVVYDSAIHVFHQFDAVKFGRDPEGKAARMVERYLTCDLMILDDLGSESPSPLIQSYLYQLVNTRLINRLHTVISTNLTLEEIGSRYSYQIHSRLDGEYKVLRFFGEDIRKQKRRRQRF